MFRTALMCASFIVLAISSPLLRADEPRKDAKEPRPEIEVCFVLDTTGSMGGLIEGAKVKIWSIANSVISQKPVPHLKIALVPFRDRGDEYITKVFDLTDDLDTVFKNIQSFKADGGGDEPESVNQALDEAVNKVAWSNDKKTTKIIFLVGDAPPHMDYKDDKKYPVTCKEAVKKDLIINTIQCGTITSTTPIWQEIAKMSEGSYVALPQEGGMVAVTTPVDKELAELNDKLNGTVVFYGKAEIQEEARAKVALNSSAAAPDLSLAPSSSGGRGGGDDASVSAGTRLFGGGAAPSTRPATEALASRLSYNAKDGGKVIQGNGDLLQDLKTGAIKLDAVKTEDLPPELQKMTFAERKAFIDAQVKKRDELQAKIAELNKSREAFIAAENKRLAESGKASAFDTKVSEIVHEEAARKK